MQTNDAVKDTINTKENQEITATIDTETVKAAMQEHPDTDTTDASEPKKKRKSPPWKFATYLFPTVKTRS